MVHDKSSVSSLIRTARSREGVIESIAPARLTEGALRTALKDLEGLGGGPVWLLDCSATESFETACIKVLSAALPDLEKKGLRRVVAVLKTPGMRMAARAVAVASRTPVKVVESRLEAVPYFTLK